MSGLVLEGISKRFSNCRGGRSRRPGRAQRHLRLPARAVRLRQDHAAADDRRPRGTDLGRILIDGKDMTKVPAHQRDFGMVFQSLALFPHLNVGENIAYPLRIRGVGEG